MPFKAKKQVHARTHSEARKVTDGHSVTQRLSLLVDQFVYEDYSPENISHQTGICST